MVISLVSLTLAGSKVKTTLPKATCLVAESSIILTVCWPGRVIEEGEKDILMLLAVWALERLLTVCWTARRVTGIIRRIKTKKRGFWEL